MIIRFSQKLIDFGFQTDILFAVPQWALGNEGCMVRALPALTVLYLPESAAVQLNADCGLAGVKKVQCTGNAVRCLIDKKLAL